MLSRLKVGKVILSHQTINNDNDVAGKRQKRNMARNKTKANKKSYLKLQRLFLIKFGIQVYKL